MISGGELSGKNFYYSETFAYAKWRVENRIKGETIDSFRLFNNLMSSMPMAFNLFHPLMMIRAVNPEAVDRMIRAAFPMLKIMYRVTAIGLEFIPTPVENYTHDHSAMDAYIGFQDKQGNNYLIAIETKYTDSLGSNTASNQLSQINLFRELEVFTDEAVSELEAGKIPVTQVYRNFLLTEKYRQVHRLNGSWSVIIAPKEHPTTDKEIASLQDQLRDRTKLFKLSLEDFVACIKAHCPAEFQPWLEWFEERYLDFSKSAQ